MRKGDLGTHDSIRGATVLYGGSFDPPHLGHQMACLYLLEGLGAAEVWLVPATNHPFKAAMTPFCDRVAMCHAAIMMFDKRVTVSEAEQTAGNTGFTYDLVHHLQKQEPERRFVLAMGSDLLAETPRWHRFDALRKLIPIVVVGRQGYVPPQGHPLGQALLPVCLPDIRSSTIRDLFENGQGAPGQISLGVKRVIEARNLYAHRGSIQG